MQKPKEVKQPIANNREPKKPKLCDGVYVEGAVNGVAVLFTADTGASRTVISTRVFEKLQGEVRPMLRQSSCLKGASGDPIRERGRAKFTIKLGLYEVACEAIVAEIEDEALLGCDILNGERGPADILLSKNKIVIDGVEIPCFQVGRQQKSRRVVVARDVSIPGQTEALVDVYVERIEEDDSEMSADYIVEPTDKFKEKYQLMMASALVDINGGPTCKIRLLNPFSKEVVLRQDAEVGVAERIERLVTVLAVNENEKETNNLESVRRITTSVRNQLQSNRIQKGKAADVPEHLKNLYIKATDGKDEHVKEVIAGLLSKHADTFSKDDWDLGITSLAEHPINTGDAQPIKQRPRRVPLAYAEEEKKAIEDLLKKGVIRESTSPWASPIVLVRKKSGAIRPCVDYRKVNALVKPDGFPLPRVQDCLDAVAGSSLFSNLDLTSGYFQIPLKPEDIPKSAFCCKYGHYEMTRMPFGLNNACSTFQRTMEIALQGLQWVTCLIYIDDIIIFGSTFAEHISRLDEVLNRIKKAGLKLKPEKCNLLQVEVVFLGHVVSKKGVRPDPNNIAKILQWPVPSNAKQVKQFVATGSYYRRFVKDFAKIAKPLTELTKQGVQFIWNEKCEKAFADIKKALISPNVMGYPSNDAGNFLLDVDASGVGLGAVLSQMQDGRERVIAYASRTLNRAESNYCVTERELLAVVYFVQYFRQYLLGRKFLVRTDHQALVWLFRLKEPSGKIARWLEILADYDLQIEYRPGRRQGHCDALSRCQNPRDCTCPDVDTSESLKCGPCKKCRKRAEDMMIDPRIETKDTARMVNTDVAEPGTSTSGSCSNHNLKSWADGRTNEELRAMQKADKDICVVLEAKIEQQRPKTQDTVTMSPASRHYLLLWDLLEVRDGVLFKWYFKKNGCGQHLQLVVPSLLKKELLSQFHNSVISGHMGVKRTHEKLRQTFYWFAMKTDVQLHLRACDVCAQDKKPQKSPRAPLGTILTGAPFDVVATDYIGPFPLTPRGNRHILVLTDHFTKYVEVLAVPDQTAETCASRILNEFIARWGCPLSILSDQGRCYESGVFRELCRLMETKKLRTSPRNPKCNGQAERYNKTLIKMVKAYLCGEQTDWDRNLGCLAGAYRATPHESTGFTPNMLTIGREVRMPAELALTSMTTDDTKVGNYGDYVDGLRDSMAKAHEITRIHLKAAVNRNKDIYDVKTAVNRYKVGDIVWLLSESRTVGVSFKLKPTFEGPYLVKEKKSELNFVLQMDKKGNTKLVHHNKLKPYLGNSPPRWITRTARKLTVSKD